MVLQWNERTISSPSFTLLLALSLTVTCDVSFYSHLISHSYARRTRTSPQPRRRCTSSPYRPASGPNGSSATCSTRPSFSPLTAYALSLATTKTIPTICGSRYRVVSLRVSITFRCQLIPRFTPRGIRVHVLTSTCPLSLFVLLAVPMFVFRRERTTAWSTRPARARRASSAAIRTGAGPFGCP